MDAWTRAADGSWAAVGTEVELEEGVSTRIWAPDAERAYLGPRELVRDGDSWEIPVGYWVSGRSLALRLVAPGRGRVIPVRVRPAVRKLTPDQWALMVDEVEQLFAGAVLGAEGGVEGSVTTDGLPEGISIEVLTTLVGPLLRAVRLIQERPRTRDVVTAQGAHPARLRRADGAAVRDLARGLSSISTTVAVERVDHPANRWIAGRLRAARRAFSEAFIRLTAIRPIDELDGDRVAWAHARGQRCGEAAEAIRCILDETFLGRLAPGGAGESILPAVLGDPVYARVHRLLRVLLHPRFRLDGAGPGAAVRPSYTLWELWCFRQVVAEQVALRPGWRRTDALAPLRGPTGGGARVALSKGADRLVVSFNPTFAPLVPGGRYSLTRELRPDVTVHEIVGGVARWWLYDAKWRVGRAALGDAFDSVHRYRDALVDEHHGGRAVGAWLIAPSPGDAPAAWLDPAWQAKWGIGVLARTPGQPVAAHVV